MILRNKIVACFLAIITTFMCSCSGDKSDGRDYIYTVSIVGNPDNLDPALATNNAAYNVILNIFDGLMSYDSNGVLCMGVAESYEVSADNLEYTFRLGESYWNGKNIEEPFPVTANDFVFGFSRSNIGYNATAKDDKTLIIQLEESDPDFLAKLTLSNAMPCNESLFNDSKGRYGLDEDNIPSNGSFFITKWFFDPYGKDNLIYTKRNSKNTEVCPSKLNYRILNSYEDTISRFQEDKDIKILLANEQLTGEYFDNLTKLEYPYSAVGITVRPDSDLANSQIKSALALSVPRTDNYRAYGLIPPQIYEFGRPYREYVNEKTLTGYDWDLANEKKMLSAVMLLGKYTILTCEEIFPTSELYPLKESWETLFGIQIDFDIADIAVYSQKIQDEDYDFAIRELIGGSINEFISQIKPISLSADNPLQIIENYESAEREIIANGDFIPLRYSTKYIYLKDKNIQNVLYIPLGNRLYLKYILTL